jgi:hypothetical protein
MGFNTRFTEVEKHMDDDKKLLEKLGKLLEAQAQTEKVDRLLGVPWQLMSSVAARQLRDDSEIGARMLYAASDRGATATLYALTARCSRSQCLRR